MKTDDELDERPDRDPGGRKGRGIAIVAALIMLGSIVAFFLIHLATR